MRLEGAVVLVTGSWSGIGEAIAERFAAEGSRVVIHALESNADSRQVASSLGGLEVHGDITDPDQVDTMVSNVVAAYGHIDVLVNNAGATRFVDHADIDGATVEVWRDILDVNLLGTWLMCQSVIREMRRSPAGCIINISALAGSTCTGSSIPYSVSKAAVNQMTRLLARVVGPTIRVNAIAPGFIDTPWTRQLDEMRSRVSRLAPLGRPGIPKDIGDVAILLALAEYMTGQVITVDGGISLVAATSEQRA